MTDPFRTGAFRARLIPAALLVFLVAVAVVFSYLHLAMSITHGQAVKAEVLRVGTYPAARVAGGDLPILTVRLANAAVRHVPATWPDVDGCKTGRAISLVQQGNTLQVARPGCTKAP